MTDHNQFQTASRSPGSRPDPTHPSRSPGTLVPTGKSQIDRALHILLAAMAIVLGALLVQVWITRNGPPALANYRPTLTTTPDTPATATPAPTATPTPGTVERAAQRIPLLQQSWDARDWKTAATYLSEIASLDHNYPGLQQAWCDTYLNWAQDLEKQCQIHQAYTLYRQASATCQDRETVLIKKELALRYLSGKWRYDHNRWSQAAAVLHTVYKSDPLYAAGCTEPSESDTGSLALRAVDARSLLYTSYVASSQELLSQGRTLEAHEAAQAAHELAPESPRVKKLLADIRSQLTRPPTPTPSSSGQEVAAQGKRIEVSISKQRMYVWQGNRLLYDWVCSTGAPGTGTATGQYKVQSKIPEAWGGQWSLRMPYWLGLYDVGSVENGIHALPIRSNGTTLWAGYLGTPVSYGCIILSTENARTLYQWANIGTPVWIYY